MIVDIPKVGPVEFPDEMTQEQVNAAAKKLYDEANVSKTETVAEGLQRTPGRMLRSTIQGAAAIPNIIADPFYRMAGLTPPAQGLRESLTAIGLPEYPSGPMGSIAEAATEALAGTGAQVAAASKAGAGALSQFGRDLAARFIAQPAAQMVAAPIAAGVSQETFRRTEDPLVSTLAAMAAGAATGVRPGRVEMSPSRQELAKRAENLYQRAESVGLRVTPDYSQQISNRLAQVAKDEGFDVGLHPKVSAVLTRLETEGQTAKSLKEVENLRRIVRAPQGDFTNPDQQRIAAKMLDAYDEMIENIGAQNVASSRNKTAVATLQEARKVYAQNKKLSIIEDIMENANIRSGQFSQSGMDNAIRVQFAGLATNKKRMAAFSPDEQAQIKNIAKGGGTTEQMLRFLGKFAVRGPVTGIFAGGGAMAEPVLGGAAVLAAEGGKRGAEAMRLQNVRNLMSQISLGRTPENRALELVQPAAMRGLLSSQTE